MIGSTNKGEKRAIIDIGSNTVRLVIYNGPPRSPVVILNEKVSAKLGRELGRTGALAEKSVNAALSALARFALLLKLRGVTNVDCVATAAARDASNGPEFLENVRKLGLSPRLLSGDEEARASAMGVIAAFPGARGTVGDLGGGSLELVTIDGPKCEGGITMPFGTLRLPDLRSSGAASFNATVRKALQATGWATKGQVRGAGLPLYIVGGSWRALALQAMRETQWPLDDPHDFELQPDVAIKLCRSFEKGRLSDVDPRISAARLATLPDAAALLAQLIENIRPSRIVFSSWGLREGLLFAQLDAKTQVQDPMLAGVEAFASMELVNPLVADAVTEWTSGLFDDAVDGNLRHAATLLSAAAMRTEPNLRAEEAMSWALRKRWIGMDARGRAMVGMAVFANSGQCEIPPELARLAEPDDLRRGIAWGLAVRLCRRLTGGSRDAMEESGLSYENGNLVLNITEPMQALYSNGVNKDLKNLAEWLGIEWSVRIEAPAPATV